MLDRVVLLRLQLIQDLKRIAYFDFLVTSLIVRNVAVFEPLFYPVKLRLLIPRSAPGTAFDMRLLDLFPQRFRITPILLLQLLVLYY